MRIAKVLTFLCLILCLIGGTNTNLSAAHLSYAATVADCSTCQGSMYYIGVEHLTENSWRVTLGIDSTFYDGLGLEIADVAVKISPNVTGVTLIGAPGNLSLWNTELGGLAANGCNGAGSGFFCSSAEYPSPALVATGFNQWVWLVETPALSLGPDGGSVKVRYTKLGEKVGDLVSEPFSLGEGPSEVPDTGTFALLGTGLALLAGIRKFRHAPTA